MLGDRVIAGMNVNVWDVTDPIQRLIRERVPVDDRRLADTDIPLADLAGGATTQPSREAAS
jgi:3-phenylpropionate/trans-cinnamate dioxygenase ferredoxin reductase subunit